MSTTNAAKQSCPAGHAYTPANTRIVYAKNRTPWRACRACEKARQKTLRVVKPASSLNALTPRQLDSLRDAWMDPDILAPDVLGRFGVLHRDVIARFGKRPKHGLEWGGIRRRSA